MTSPDDQERIVSGEAIPKAILAIDGLGGVFVVFGIAVAGLIIPTGVPRLNAIRSGSVIELPVVETLHTECCVV